jgi:hypothetical protein
LWNVITSLGKVVERGLSGSNEHYTLLFLRINENRS